MPGPVTHGRERARDRPLAMKVDCLVQKVTLLDACVLTGYLHVLTMMRSVVHKRLLGRIIGVKAGDSRSAVRSGSRSGRHWPLL